MKRRSRSRHVYRIGRALRDLVIKSFVGLCVVFVLAGSEYSFSMSRVGEKMDAIDKALRGVQLVKRVINVF